MADPCVSKSETAKISWAAKVIIGSFLTILVSAEYLTYERIRNLETEAQISQRETDFLKEKLQGTEEEIQRVKSDYVLKGEYLITLKNVQDSMNRIEKQLERINTK